MSFLRFIFRGVMRNLRVWGWDKENKSGSSRTCKVWVHFAESHSSGCRFSKFYTYYESNEIWDTNLPICSRDLHVVRVLFPLTLHAPIQNAWYNNSWVFRNSEHNIKAMPFCLISFSAVPQLSIIRIREFISGTKSQQQLKSLTLLRQTCAISRHQTFLPERYGWMPGLGTLWRAAWRGTQLWIASATQPPVLQ
jgi:hypothetical protein